MQDLRSLITRRVEALKGKSFPRRVTAVNGSIRWQGYSGRSFATRDEAQRNQIQHASLCPEWVESGHGGFGVLRVATEC